MKTTRTCALTALLALVIFCPTALFAKVPAKLIQANEDVTLLVNGASTPVESKIRGFLPEGSVLTTGPEGEAFIEALPGIVIKLLPGTQVHIEEHSLSDSRNLIGELLLMSNIAINSGTMVAVISEQGIMTAALNVITPRGTVFPTEAGEYVISVTGTGPDTWVVTAASVRGSAIVNTSTSVYPGWAGAPVVGAGKGTVGAGKGTVGPGKGVLGDYDPRDATPVEDGETIVVPEGMAVQLGPDGFSMGPVSMDFVNIAQVAVSQIGGLGGLGVPFPPPMPPVLGPSIDANQPTPTPTPVPTPAPLSP